MNLHETIADLNKRTREVYIPRQQKGIRPHLSLMYPAEDGVQELVERVSSSLESKCWMREEIKKLSCSSVLALMAIPLNLDHKIRLVTLVKKWAHITRTEENTLAAIIQSLRISEVDFNLTYTIRTALFNYVTNYSIKETTVLKILPDGKVELHLRETSRFEGDSSAELTFLLSKLRQVTDSGATTFKTLAQYDFRRDSYIERSPQITTPLSSFRVSGYSRENCVAKNFGKASFEVIDCSPALKSFDHSCPHALYEANTAWMPKKWFRSCPKLNKKKLSIVAPIKDWQSSSVYDSGYSDNSLQASPSSSSNGSFDFPPSSSQI